MPARKHIAVNAHLLSGEASYRSAGIHGYIANTLRFLPECGPDFDFTVMVGQGQIAVAEQISVSRSRLPTQRPLVRILWEQMVAPVTLARLQPDLLHGMGFSLPLAWRGASVVTI